MWTTVCVLTLCLHRASVLAKIYEECASLADDVGVYVASQTSCSKYVYCAGDSSFEAACFADDYYDPVTERCVPYEAFECRVAEGSVQVIKLTTSAIVDFNPTEAPPPGAEQPLQQLPPNPSDMAATDEASVPNIFDEAVDEPQASAICPPADSVNSNSDPNVSNNNNSGQGQQMQLPNPASCASYFLCYNGIPIAMHCARGLSFDRQTGRCAPSATVECTSTTQPAVRSECRAGVFDFMPHTGNCAYFYYCSNGYPMIHRCPQDYTWHFERRTCVHHTQSKCYNKALHLL